MRITSGIDFLQSKNKFWMDDESPGFSSTVVTILTINAISEKLRARVSRVEQTFQDSENQANRYMLQDKDLGLGNQDSCPWRECKTNRTTGFWRLLPMNWEAPSVLRRGSSLRRITVAKTDCTWLEIKIWCSYRFRFRIFHANMETSRRCNTHYRTLVIFYVYAVAYIR
jgi:hypothetical protein